MNKNLRGTDDPNIPSDTYNPNLNYIRPKDAATLIIVRDGKEVLMGVRSAKHAFMPNKFVFPGGAVDAVDATIPLARPPKPGSGCSGLFPFAPG